MIYSNDIKFNDLNKVFIVIKIKIEDKDNNTFELSDFKFDLKKNLKANNISFFDQENNLLEMKNGL